MSKNPLIQVRLNAARYQLDTLRNNRQRLSNELLDITIMRNFFNAFNHTINADGSNQQAAVDAGLATLPHEDNPNTPQDERMSPDEFWKMIGKEYPELLDGLTYEESHKFDTEFMNTHNKDKESIGYKIREIVAKQMDFSSQMSDVDAEIADLIGQSQTE